MKVRVMSKNHFDKLMPRINILDENVEESNYAFISITGIDGAKSYFDKDHLNVLRLYFDDVTKEEYDRMLSLNFKDNTLFAKEHAEAIIEFVERNKDKYELFVHCLAGVSRSGAVGMFINDITQYESYLDFANSNPQIKPNAYVTALLRRVYNNIPLDDL